ncbi:hypothetical protein OROGR_023964 [Orobanche gracilis]
MAWNLAIYYWHNCTELGSTKILQFLQFIPSPSGKSERTTKLGFESVSNQQHDGTPPASARRSSGIFRRSKPDKRRPSLPAATGPSTSYHNQPPKSKAIKIELQKQRQFISPEDVVTRDSKGALEERPGLDHEIEGCEGQT